MTEKCHWFSLTFIAVDWRESIYASAYRGVPESQGARLKISDIGEAKKTAGVRVDAVLINSTYMGLWTKEDFTGEG